MSPGGLPDTSIPRGAVHVLFDADEHTGRFGGVRAYLAAIPRLPDAVSLGYPGNDCIVVGSRGFLRAKLHFSGRAAHSGETERSRHQCADQGRRLCAESGGGGLARNARCGVSSPGPPPR